ncbi:hypothetical protein [Peredibacter starrii]|uniref:Uncharacterized protein n=1 Tax=Peredibacter starrii TaxID=28202 RepID=A0AAX4HQ78_9BACT|nr:hypothetical protein [Peredibacter starrii]WPU65357.1 hypothetical protein SOO65_01200 [Peredibacter starrii]
MKKFSILLLSMATMPVYAQGILGSLNSYQESLEPKHVSRTGEGGSSTTVGSSSKPVPEVKPSGGASSTTNNKCEENDQTSLPLSYITSLIMEKDGKLDIVHDPRQGTLTVKSPDMISNCSSMLDWKLKQPEIQGKKAYAIEVKFNSTGECSDQGCKYKIAKVKNGEFEKYEEMVFKPTLKGFEECLQKSGVIVNGKVDPKAIYSSQANEKFNGIEQSGRLLFLSHGPSSPMVKAKYGTFEAVDRCDYYEQAHPQVKNLLTLADEEKERLDAEAAKLKDCPINEYYKVADFLEKYEDYSAQLGQVRDRLILESAKKSAEAILKGKYTEDDLKVMGDFERYIVQPKIDLAISLYQQMVDLEGDAKKAKQEELKVVLAELSTYRQKPYFTGVQTKKLIEDGRFEEAEKLNSIMISLDNYHRLGSKQENVVITPSVAASRVTSARQAFKSQLETERENYEIRTGQTTGKSDYYAQLAKRMRQNIQIRSQNFSAEIQSEYERVQQPNGYCFKYWRNAQKCIQDTVERIQELTALLQHYNKIDEERAAEYDAKAKSYGELEAQGRRYIAAQNGEEVVEERVPKQDSFPEDTTRPQPRAAEAQQPQQGQNGVYNFQWPQQQAQMTPQNYQYPQTPYAQQNMFMQQQNPYQYYSQPLGAQAYGGYQMQGGYNFQWGAGNQMYPQQQMYQNYNPYMQYNQYSMYR